MMMHALWFSCKRHIWQPATIYKGLALVVVAVALCFLDVIWELGTKTAQSAYPIQATTAARQQLNHPVYGPIADESAPYVDYRDGEWIVYANSGLANGAWEQLYRDMMRADIPEAIEQYESWDKKAHVTIVFDQVREMNAIIQIVVSILFFLFIGRTLGMISELLEEKQTRMLELHLSCMSGRRHLLWKTGVCHLQAWLDVAMACMAAAGGLLARYQYDGAAGLVLFLQQQGWPITELFQWLADHRFQTIASLVSLIIGLFGMQMVILVCVSRVKEPQEVTSYALPTYVLCIIMYYASCFLVQGSTVTWLWWLPGIRTLTFSFSLCRVSLMTVLVGVLVTGCYTGLAIRQLAGSYERRLLGIKKLRST